MQLKTDKELRKLAKQVHSGEVFLSNKPDIIQMSFMVLMLADPSTLPEDIGSVYEFMREAAPRSINGYPIFFSAHFLSTAETQKVLQYVKEIEELLKEFE
jgi:hypothetical protein